MVLWRADGHGISEIARMAGVQRPTVYLWLRRYEEGGLDALENRVSTGRPRSVSVEARSRIVALTKMTPPAETGLTHWSSHGMANYLRRCEGISVSHNFVAQLWRDNGLKPHRTGTFKISQDPDLAAKVTDIVGLYLDPPANAVVLSVDEKPQVQATERTQPPLTVDRDRTAKHTHDYYRHGTTDLFAALDVLTGKVTGRCFAQHRTTEFLTFMSEVTGQYPEDRDIHVVVDNLSTHDNPDVTAWLARHPKVTFHFTPVGSSWMNQVETWFSIISRQAIHRGSFSTVGQLVRRITTFITYWNTEAKPFTWTATANEILDKIAILNRDFKKLVGNNQN